MAMRLYAKVARLRVNVNLLHDCILFAERRGAGLTGGVELEQL
jgi:hypothetical protein